MHANETPPHGPQALPVVEAQPPDAWTVLQRLRTQYPRWGFVHDPGAVWWTAVRGDEGTGVTIRRPDPVALRLAVEETVRGRR